MRLVTLLDIGFTFCFKFLNVIFSRIPYFDSLMYAPKAFPFLRVANLFLRYALGKNRLRNLPISAHLSPRLLVYLNNAAAHLYAHCVFASVW